MSTLLTVGVPKEIKPMEARIALVPHAVADLVGVVGVLLVATLFASILVLIPTNSRNKAQHR